MIMIMIKFIEGDFGGLTSWGYNLGGKTVWKQADKNKKACKRTRNSSLNEVFSKHVSSIPIYNQSACQ